MTRGSWTRSMVELVGWIVTAAVGAVMLTQTAGWDGTRLVATLQSLTPYALPPVAVVAGSALRFRRAPLACTAALVGIAIIVLAAPLAFPGSRPPVDPRAEGIRAASVNLLYSNTRVDEVADDLLERDLDVIVFSEYTPDHGSTLVAHRLAQRFPYQINRDGLFAGGMAIWSRTPIEENPRQNTINRTVDATLDHPDGQVRIFAVHPPTPIFDFDGWLRDLGRISEQSDSSSLPTLVIGDFNASYWHPVFRSLLRSGLTDAHIVNRRGWSVSWPTDEFVPPFVRLDHALTSDGLVATDVDDFAVAGSDHRGFVVTVKPTAARLPAGDGATP